MIEKLKKYYKKEKNIISKISLNAASLSFYTIISVSSLVIIIGFILNHFNDSFKLTLVSDLVEILGITFNGLINQSLQRINSINIILIFSILISSSSIFNCYNKFCDGLYRKEKKRKKYHNLISSVLMFLMMILMLLFLLVFLFYGSYFVRLIFKNIFVGKIIQFIFELFLFYFIFVILLIYFPPVKMRFYNVYKESFFLTLTIYIIIKVFIILFNLLYRKYKIIGLLFVFSSIGYLIYIIHFIICYVLYYIWKNEEYIKI